MGYFDCVYECGQSPRAKAVYFYLKDHADKEGTCWPGINTIAAGLSLSRSTVKRALRELEQAGMIEKKTPLAGERKPDFKPLSDQMTAAWNSAPPNIFSGILKRNQTSV